MSIITFLTQVQDKLPKDILVISIENKFNALPKDKQERALAYLKTLKIKNPTSTFWLSFFFGIWGVGYFSIGNIPSGCVRLIFFNLYVFIKTISDDHSYFSIAFFMFVCLIILWFYDMFVIEKLTRKKNLEKILNIIDRV